VLSGVDVGGLTPLSTTDYPGQLAAVVFCQGCPWQCGYCHNPHLIPRDSNAGGLSWPEVKAFLLRRQGLLDAVVFSGGEPTLQSGLAQACQEARELGFKIGLHTAGPYPARLTEVLPWLDWVGMDVKASFADYDRITGVPGSGERARESLSLLLDSGVAHEIRTTVHPDLLSAERLIAWPRLAALGIETSQAFRAQGCATRARPQAAFPATCPGAVRPCSGGLSCARGERLGGEMMV
jgi:pyruvate formate lyase activating enzyme